MSSLKDHKKELLTLTDMDTEETQPDTTRHNTRKFHQCYISGRGQDG